jgi:hypothetical protein
MKGPKTATATNAPLTGETHIVAGVSSQTITIGWAHQMAMESRRVRREKIVAVLSKYLTSSLFSAERIASEIIEAEDS